MERLIEKAMEFDQVDFNDLEEGKQYLLYNEPDGGEFGDSVAILTCVRLYKAEDEVYYTYFTGDFMRDSAVFISGGFHITPDERIKIYNWPPAIDGTGAQNTVNPAGGGTGGTGAQRKKSRKLKRKNRKSRKNRH